MATQEAPKLVLASLSPRRRELLETLGLTFMIEPSEVDETIHKPLPPALVVQQLADRKAEAVVGRLRERSEDKEDGQIVIASDTVVALSNQILGKPKNQADAVEMLLLLQSRTHTVYTGLCVQDVWSGQKELGFSATDVTFRPLSRGEILRYVETGEPLDKAGAYGIQGLGSTLVSKIHGDYFTVVGLPLCLLATYLRKFGVEVF